MGAWHKENILLHKDARSDVKFMWSIYLAVAKKYTDNLREEAMKGWAEKLAQGWIPCSPPVGYMTVIKNGKRIHVPNPANASLVAKVFELYLHPDHTISSVCNQMAVMGITTSKGKPFSKSHTHDILSNPFYIGINRFDGKEYPGAQEPLISKELFNMVQAKLHRHRPGAYSKHMPLFKAVLHCGHCDKLITWDIQKNFWYGSCQRKADACKTYPLLKEDVAEKQIIDRLQVISDADGALLKRIKARLSALHPEEVVVYREKIIKAIEQQLSRLHRMSDALYDNKLAGDISEQAYQAKREQYDERLQIAQSRLERLQQTPGRQRVAPVKQYHTRNAIIRLYMNSTSEDKRIILSVLFKKIIARGQVLEFIAA